MEKNHIELNPSKCMGQINPESIIIVNIQ